MSIHPDFRFVDAAVDLQATEPYVACRLPFGVGSRLPPRAYTSTVFQELENEAIWTRVWVCIGSVHEIPQTGDLLPYTIGNHAIHVQRQSDGSLIGRFNKAQHGGCRSVPAQCRTGKKTKCSYTSCGHSRDRAVIPGDVLGSTASLMGQYLGGVPERLMQVKLRNEAGFIFANIDPSPGNDAEVQPLPHGDLVMHGETVWREHRANWKLAGSHLMDAADDCTGRCQATWSFPNMVRLETSAAVAVINLQPTATDQTVWRVAYFAKDSSALQEAELDDLNGVIGRAAAAAERGQLAVERADFDDRLETSGAAWRFNQTLIEHLTRRQTSYWNVPLTDATIASAP